MRFFNRRQLVGLITLGGGLNRDYWLAEARKTYKVLIGDGVLLLYK